MKIKEAFQTRVTQYTWQYCTKYTIEKHVMTAKYVIAN